MDWIRPASAEVDKLEALGNPGWNWDSLEPVGDLSGIPKHINPWICH